MPSFDYLNIRYVNLIVNIFFKLFTIKFIRYIKREIKLLPSDVILKATKIQNVTSIKIEEYKEEAVYSVKGTTKARLFFIIPVTANVVQKINAGTGEIMKTERPWWSFLALGV